MQGKLVEDFASLLKTLWSQEYLCVFPSKFKRGLIKYKSQFAGNEQQDSQVRCSRRVHVPGQSTHGNASVDIMSCGAMSATPTHGLVGSMNGSSLIVSTLEGEEMSRSMLLLLPPQHVICFSSVPYIVQEFLAEMLDALHEDVNRVIDKPYVAAPDDDEAESGRSDQDLADEAWDRHVQRNRSVIVDLFQGQLKMECRCTVCNKKVRHVCLLLSRAVSCSEHIGAVTSNHVMAWLRGRCCCRE